MKIRCLGTRIHRKQGLICFLDDKSYKFEKDIVYNLSEYEAIMMIKNYYGCFELVTDKDMPDYKNKMLEIKDQRKKQNGLKF
jgi:hypothetical protein